MAVPGATAPVPGRERSGLGDAVECQLRPSQGQGALRPLHLRARRCRGAGARRCRGERAPPERLRVDAVAQPGGRRSSRETSRVKICVLGNALPLYNPPTRVAEEMAMLDVMSGGRLISGLVVGGGPEYYSTNVNPTDARPRFREAVELILQAWTRPGPFAFDGEYLPIAVREPVAAATAAAPPAGVDPRSRLAEHHHLLRRARVRLHGGGLLRAPRDLRPPGGGLSRRGGGVGQGLRSRAARLAHDGVRGRHRRAGRGGGGSASRLLPGDAGGGVRGAREGVDAARLHRPARPSCSSWPTFGGWWRGRGPPTPPRRCGSARPSSAARPR